MGKSPSRERYEEENPVVSFRISRGAKEQLDELVETLDTTKKDWFETVIQEQSQAVDSAWEAGYEVAKDEYCVEIPCVICEEPIELTDDEAKEKVAGMILDVAHENFDDVHWWRGHPECL